jgi:DNA-binding beta-propeller fold protein YncE
MMVNIDGGTATPFVTGQGRGGAIAIDASNLYWSTDSATYQAPLAGGQPISIGPAAAAIAVDGSYVYLALNGGQAGLGSVVLTPIGGGGSFTIASARPPTLGAIAVDATHVYWVEGWGTIGMGAVVAADKSGGPPLVIASGLHDPSAIAVDDTNVYIANTGAGEVDKIAK